MTKSSLLLEHRHNGRVLKKLRLTPLSRSIVIGSNAKSDIRLIGAEVSSFHAVIEPRNDGWYVFDFGSSTGTWINKESVNEFKIENELVVQIGLHELWLKPVSPQRELFKNETEESRADNFTHHQVVVRSEGGLLETHLLPRVRSFKIQIGNQTKEFTPPKSGQWSTQQEGKLIIQQRLISDPGRIEREKFSIDKEMRWPVLVSSLVVLVMAITVALKPGQPETPKVLEELENNKYASIIYDAKITVEKKKESVKAAAITRKTASAGSGGGSTGGAPTTEVAKGSSTKKLLTQVKATNLSALIGKIAKRSSANGLHIAAQGISADKGDSGRAIASVAGATAGNTNNNGVSNGQGFKLAGVGTTGKGGGGNYKEGTGLGMGGVGSANVGIIEEETEVGGGLDKDIIAEIIKSELGQIRYCYERQLSAHPDLYGKILVKFTIDLNGTVAEQRVGSSTLKNADVEGCILRRVARWKFPQPKGGTSVLVTYPFLFKSTN